MTHAERKAAEMRLRYRASLHGLTASKVRAYLPDHPRRGQWRVLDGGDEMFVGNYDEVHAWLERR